MAPLTKDRNTMARTGDLFSYVVKPDVTIFAGAITTLNANGQAVPGAEATGLVCVGRADERCMGNGSRRITVRRGVFRFDNATGTDAVMLTDIHAPCFIVDDHTVARTDKAATRSPCGTVVDVEDGCVWVRI